MLIFPKYTKILKLAVCLFMITTAIFLLGNFSLAANFWNANGTADPNGAQFANDAGLAGSGTNLYATITRVIRWFIGFLGIIAVILIIYAGFIWMTSGGDEKKVEQAKTILKNALIGLILIILAFAIVSFILNFLTGVTGGGGNGRGNNPPVSYGLSALGNGIIQSHYPARDQKEVPRNTSIIITFREAMLASTLCENPVGNPAKCDGSDVIPGKGNLNKNVIGIFRQSDETNCIANNSPLPLPGCASLVADVRVYSIDGKTFVFVPINYLGSPSEYLNYTVYLGKGLLRQTGELAFPSGFGRDYGWSFEVSNKIDLIPPQVMHNGVFPSPDNARDTTVPGTGNQAEGTITVNSPRVYRRASVSGITPAASVEVNETCSRVGSYNITIADGPISTSTLYTTDAQGNTINLGPGTISGQTVAFSLCNLKLTIGSGSFGTGNLWTFTINPMIAADTITVGNTVYTASNVQDVSKHNFEVGDEDKNTAENIKAVLANNSEVTAIRSGWAVSITAKLAGVAGNSINLSSSNDSRLKVVAMAGGTDKVDTVTVRGGRKDQPMNSAIQINFNEAIMPLTVSGTADEVKAFIRVVNANLNPVAKDGICKTDADCESFKCKKNNLACQQDETGCTCVGTNNYLEGKFAISNQYQTVEFLSDKECGFNACGEKIYCLPANSDLRVELNAASLITCATNDDCKANSPFNTCDTVRKFCWDGAKYFPQAAKTYSSIVNGITDAAFNSLDGNRNNSAYGPDKFYNENTPVGVCESGTRTHKGNNCTDANKATVCGTDVSGTGIKCFIDGDNYKWSFFISNILDLTPPKIKDTIPVIDGANVPLADKITIRFNKVMLSSRLTTGSLMIQNGKQNIQHYLLNLRSLADQPVGYWVTNIGQLINGEIISTDAYVNHSLFSQSSTYNAQAGSGLKDIYQNCFLPCSSESLTGNPSCCNGAVHNKATCP